tara:strand:+ start:2365 stop:2610 length:246 start_codon:yes stop_codon:yes gene_type:complete
MNRKEVEDIVKKTLEQAREFLHDEDATIWLGYPEMETDTYGGEEITVSLKGEELEFEHEIIFDQTMDRLEDEKIVSPKEKK